jgi:mRNA interferase RelE/StbE
MATVKLTPEADEQMARLPKKVRERVAKMVKCLEAWPIVSGVKALSGNLAGQYRARVGDHRIRFRVDGDNVLVDKIGHRKDVYEN